MKPSKLTQSAMLAAAALIFGYIESLFPLPVSIPGIKLGLANIVILFAVYRLGATSAFFIMIIKVFVSSLLWGGIGSLIYSIFGGILSLFSMLLFKKQLSIVGISILGGIMHNIGQLTAAALVLNSFSVFYYMPFLIISGLLVGFSTGEVCKTIILRLKNTKNGHPHK